VNWKRIVLFGLAEFLLSEFSPPLVEPSSYVPWRILVNSAFFVTLEVILLAWFAAIQRERTVAHVGIAAATGWLVSFAPTAIVRHAPPVVWASSMLALVVIVALGIGLGLLVRRLRGHRTGPAGESPHA